jgi:hypothetical protein
MMDHEKPQAVFPQVFEFTPGHEIVINEQLIEHSGGVTPDIEVSSTLVGDGEQTQSPPPGEESVW